MRMRTQLQLEMVVQSTSASHPVLPVKVWLARLGGPKLDNLALMTASLDLAEASSPSAGAHSSVAQSGNFIITLLGY